MSLPALIITLIVLVVLAAGCCFVAWTRKPDKDVADRTPPSHYGSGSGSGPGSGKRPPPSQT